MKADLFSPLLHVGLKQSALGDRFAGVLMGHRLRVARVIHAARPYVLGLLYVPHHNAMQHSNTLVSQSALSTEACCNVVLMHSRRAR
jgi:hypothetical protein